MKNFRLQTMQDEHLRYKAFALREKLAENYPDTRVHAVNCMVSSAEDIIRSAFSANIISFHENRMA